MTRPRTVLVLGGVRAGKSAFAVARARRCLGGVAFVATAEPGDADMASRIARHRAERPSGWLTVEAPRDLLPSLRTLSGTVELAIVDCLNLWVANLLDDGVSDCDVGRIVESASELSRWLAGPPFDVIVVSNEVGSGIHPETALGRCFRDALGLVNQSVARVATEVVLVVAGCPVWVKGRPPRGTGTP